MIPTITRTAHIRLAEALLMLLLFCCWPCLSVMAGSGITGKLELADLPELADQSDTSDTSDTSDQSDRSAPLFPQKPKSLLWRIDSLLTIRYRRIHTDTLYVIRPQTKWVIKTRGNISGATMYMRGTAHGNRYSALMTSDIKGTLNLSVGYLGLSVGVSVNPASWAGKYKDYEFNLNSYSNRWGVDLVYHNQQSAGGWVRRDGMEQMDIPHGAVLSKTLNLNAYLAFSHRRFSFPAAFSQSYIQRRSAGSWLLGLSLMWQRIESDRTLATDISASRLNSFNIALGAGYGYNFAMRRRWLLHLSALPTLVIWSQNRIWNDRQWRAEQMHVPDVILTGRMALVKNYRRNFLGASLIFNFSALGESDRLRVHTTKWRARLFYGWRL